MEQYLNFVTLGVADLAVSRLFYQQQFGWQEMDDSDENIAFFRAGATLILALFPQEGLAEDATVSAVSGGGFPRFTLAHNVASAAEVDAVLARLQARGVDVVKTPQATFWGGYSGYVRDPDGFLWEICNNPYLDAIR